MFTYAFKRVIRSWKLFVALMLGVILASSFFAGINISVDSIGTRSLQQQLEQVYADIVVASSGVPVFSSKNVTTLRDLLLSNMAGVKSVDVISKVVSVQARPVRLFLPDGENITFRPFVDTVIGISKGSKVYNGIISDGQIELGENETFIESDSDIASRLKVGDTLNVSIPVIIGSGTGARLYYVRRNLTVAGFVSLDDSSYLMALGIYTFPVLSMLQPSIARRVSHNFIMVDWEKTFVSILDEINSYTPSYSPVVTNLLVNLDRESLLNPWDIEGSKANLDRVVSVLTNTVKVNYGNSNINLNNNLLNVFRVYEGFSTLMTLQGVILSLPVFFVAWYVGLTVSDVSFHLRRREIGLLLTKGFTNRQLLKLFLTEAAFVGIIGAAAGLLLGAFFTPIFSMGQFADLPVVQMDTALAVAVFSICIALLAVFQPARRAANFRPIETLREYLGDEDLKPYRKIWVWLAMGLGTYKIIMLLLGLRLDDIMPSSGSIIGAGRGGFLTAILLAVARFVDNILLYVGPILFFWGFTKMFVAQSLRFQNLLARVTSPLVKDLSLLAEKNIQRNAARIASTTFLLAVIMIYAVSTVGQIATQNDYTSRIIYENIGADINVIPDSLKNVCLVKDTLISNFSEIAAIAVEYRGFAGQTTFGADSSSTQLSAIDPEEWLKAAYYEDEWFTGGPAEQLVRALSNETIILEGRFYDYVKVGDKISITIGGKAFNLVVIGFYGPSSATISGLPQAQQLRLNLVLRSYISESIYAQVNKSVSSTARILVKLKPGQDGEAVAQKIKEMPGVEWVNSAAEQIRMRATNVLLSGSLNVSRLGVFFATLAATVGTALVTVVTLLEKRKEITLLMVRGLSLKQVILTLLTENLGTIVIAGVMGSVVGYLVHRGNVASSTTATGLVVQRVIFPADAIMNLAMIYGLLVVSMVVPIVIIVIMRASRLVWRI
ncbi:MAG: FtsX-like permease family protein [Candidatus Bathyarchaeia archaeon]